MQSLTNPHLAAIIIVNWNGRQYLERCLTALFDQPLADTHVIVVDNGSIDGSVEWLAEHQPRVQTISLPRNLGFAAANNIGIASSTARYIITLNNDTEVEAGWVESLIAVAESDASIGSCAARLVLDTRRDMLDSAGIAIDRFGFAWQRGHGKPDAARYREAGDVWGASAAAALYRREMLDRIGTFDEEFESYYEDVDLAWRAQRTGWRCRYVPQHRVMHVHSATGGRNLDYKQYLLTRNRWWTLIKNYPVSRLWYMWPLIGAADLISLARGLAAHCTYTPIRARLDALRGLRRMWGKRKMPN